LKAACSRYWDAVGDYVDALTEYFDADNLRMSMTTTCSNPTKGRNRESSEIAANKATSALKSDVAGLPKGTHLAYLDSIEWRRWGHHIKSRMRPAPLAQLMRLLRVEPLLWGIASRDADGDSHELVQELHRRTQSGKGNETELVYIVEKWLQESPARRATVALGIECLAWCRCLPVLATRVTAAQWSRLIEQLIGIAEDASAISMEQAPLAQQLLAGELPLTLALLFPEIARCTSLAKSSRKVLSDGIMELLDEGLPSGQHLPIAAGLLACWTRVVSLGKSLSKESLRGGALDQYRNLVRASVSLLRSDGSQMFGPRPEAGGNHLIKEALAVAGDECASASAEALFFGQTPPVNGRSKLLLPTAAHSEWSELAIMRANWSKNSPILATNFSAGELRCELVSQQRVIWSGHCDPKICIDGVPAAKVERWEEVCWFTDEDVHYIELEGELGVGWKIQRQFLLARTDAVLLVADAVIGPAVAQIEYACTYSLPETIAFVPASETSEGTVQAGARRLANLLPLALPEWRADGRRGVVLEAEPNGVTYRISATSQRLYVPLFVDLEPWRMKRDLTWRQLTIGFNLVAQPADVAVGYRVQLYKQQWLIYRSLARRASRTVLGQNIYSEFVCARLNRGGDADTLIEIE
jgi:hypothetical protein